MTKEHRRVPLRFPAQGEGIERKAPKCRHEVIILLKKFLKGLTMLCSNKTQKSNTSSDINRAKRLYFSNYANYYNMRRNGEYEEYMKYSIPDTVEQEWSKIILDSLVKKVQNGEDIWLVYNIANVRIDESEIIKSFQTLSKSPNVHEIISAFEKFESLIPPQLFGRIKEALLA